MTPTPRKKPIVLSPEDKALICDLYNELGPSWRSICRRFFRKTGRDLAPSSAQRWATA